MTGLEFMWFRKLLREMIPAMARAFDVRLEPKFGLDDQDRWYLPVGDLRRLDRQLLEADEDDQYSSFRPEQYM